MARPKKEVLETLKAEEVVFVVPAPKPKAVMRMTVIHDGVKCEKGEEAPAKFLEFFKAQGFTEEV